jgi:heptosyltransferase-3
MKIWIIRTGALGDFVLTLPVIHNLCHAFPHAQITLLGNANTLALAQVDVLHIHDINRADWAPLFATESIIPNHLHEQFEDTDLVISYLPDPAGIFATNLKRAGVQTVLTCPPHPPDDGSIHAIEHLLQPLRDLAIPIQTNQPTIHLTQDDHNAVTPYIPNGSSLIIHPGSGGASKRWPPEHFAAIASDISQKTNSTVLISTGPADGDLAHLIAEKTSALILPPLPIRHLAALMIQCSAYLGNDSGPSHLAAAVGLPTIALFGPTDPRIWSPRGATIHILQASDDQMTSIGLNEVLAATRSILP